MVSSRKIFSTRFAVSAFIVVGMALLCLWSYLFSFANRVFSFGAGLPLLFCAILWSWYEILRFRKEKLRKGLWIYSFVFSALTLAPAFVLMGGGSSATTLEKARIGYGMIGLFILTVVIWVWGRIMNGRICWMDCDLLFRGKSWIMLMISALWFWNVVLFMIICSAWQWMAIVFALAALCDTFAYLFGSRYGKTKLSMYSPNKTKEGFLFSVISVSAVFFVFWAFLPTSALKNLLGNNGGILLGKCVAWFLCILGTIVCGLGDLHFSMHKRIFEVKSYSRVLGPHGGFWDRFDSHCFAFVFWGICAFIWKGICGIN